MKEIGISMKFSIEGALRGLGQMVSESKKAELQFQQMETKIQAGINETGRKIEDSYNKRKKLTDDLITKEKELEKVGHILDASSVKKQAINDLKNQISITDKQIVADEKLHRARIKNLNAEISMYKKLESARRLADRGEPSSGGSRAENAIRYGLASGSVGSGIASLARTAIPLGVGYMAARTATSSVMNDIALDREMLQVYNAAGVTSQGTKAYLKAQVMGASSVSGIDAVDQAKQYAQLISSAQFSPGKEGSAGYMKAIQDAGAVSARMAMSAKASGAESKEYMDAATYTAQAFGVNMKDSKAAEHVFDTLAYAQKMGKGTMAEYAQQFQKFMPSAKSVGWGMEESASLFANLSNQYTPTVAGTAMTHFEKLFAQAPTVQAYVSGRVDSLTKGGRSIVGNKADDAMLRGLSGDTVKNMYYNADGSAKGLLKTNQAIVDTYNKLKSTEAKSFYLSLMSKNDLLSLKALQMLTGDANTTDEFGNIIKSQGISVVAKTASGARGMAGMNQGNIAMLEDSISGQFDILTQTWKNGMIGFANSAEGPIKAIFAELTAVGNALPRVGNAMSGVLGYDTNPNYSPTKGIIPERKFTLGSQEESSLLGQLNSLASSGGGKSYVSQQDRMLSGNAFVDTIADRIAGGKEVGEKDFIDYFGKNASTAMQAYQSSVAKSGVDHGVANWMTLGVRRLMGGDDATLHPEKYESSKFADTLGGIGSSIDIMDRENRIKDSAEVKAQTAIQEKMLGQLAVIASKNFGSNSILESVANIFHPTGTTAQGNGKIPALNTTVKSK